MVVVLVGSFNHAYMLRPMGKFLIRTEHWYNIIIHLHSNQRKNYVFIVKKPGSPQHDQMIKDKLISGKVDHQHVPINVIHRDQFSIISLVSSQG
jgi:hypothetical protein